VSYWDGTARGAALFDLLACDALLSQVLFGLSRGLPTVPISAKPSAPDGTLRPVSWTAAKHALGWGYPIAV